MEWNVALNHGRVLRTGDAILHVPTWGLLLASLYGGDEPS